MCKYLYFIILLFVLLDIEAKVIVVNQRNLNAKDCNLGTLQNPLKTIQAGANLAQPGDTVLVKSGIYREQVAPQYSGEPDKPITYLAAPGEFVSIRGSEPITDWRKESSGLWVTTIENSFFGDFNPYVIRVAGAWLDGHGTSVTESKYHLGDVYCNNEVLNEVFSLNDCIDKPNTWYTMQEEDQTVIYVNFDVLDPNQALIEINVRSTVIFPKSSGLKYIIIDGFDVRHSASQWCDIYKLEEGAIGTRFGYKWIIQNCTISNSRNNGISMGVTDEIYFSRELEKGGDNIPSYGSVGFHTIRNNKITHCGQCGIYGCYGAVGSIIENNEISETACRGEWFGPNQADIKILFPIDVIISGNRCFGKSGCERGIWLDWGAQNVRVTKNLIVDRKLGVFTEVSFGPTVIDNNILIRSGIQDWSDGNIYVHNMIYKSPLFDIRAESERPFVPYYQPHSTQVAGRNETKQRHERWYNNIFIGDTLQKEPIGVESLDNFIVNYNVYIDNAPHFSLEGDNSVILNTPSKFCVYEDLKGDLFMSFELDSILFLTSYPFITSKLIGKIPHAEMFMEHLDGMPLNIETDYNGDTIDLQNVKPGPFQNIMPGVNNLKIWTNM